MPAVPLFPLGHLYHRGESGHCPGVCQLYLLLTFAFTDTLLMPGCALSDPKLCAWWQQASFPWPLGFIPSLVYTFLLLGAFSECLVWPSSSPLLYAMVTFSLGLLICLLPAEILGQRRLGEPTAASRGSWVTWCLGSAFSGIILFLSSSSHGADDMAHVGKTVGLLQGDI